MRAQVAACRTADAAINKLIKRYGSSAYQRIIEELHNHAERYARRNHGVARWRVDLYRLH